MKSRISFKTFNKFLLYIGTFYLSSTLLTPTIAHNISKKLSPFQNQTLKNINANFNSISSQTILNKLDNNNESMNSLIKIEKAIDEKIEQKLLAGIDLEEALKQIKIESTIQTKSLPNDVRSNLNGYIDHLLEKKNDNVQRESFSRNEYFESLYNQLSKNENESKENWLEVLNSRDQKNDSVGFPSHPRRILNRDITITKSEKFSAQVKASIFGVEISAGPTLSFERRFVINAKLIASGDEPIVSYNSDFNAGVLNHSDKRRIVFLCTVTAQATHKLNGSAGLTILGTGATIERGRWESISVQQTSKLKEVPFIYANGRRTNIKDIENICVKEFYIKNKKSLSNEVKLATSELVYTHSQNQCATDINCVDWHRSLLGIIQGASNPRCASSKINGNPVNICQLRGKKGNACKVVDKDGKRLSAGYFEYPCDKGLKCTIIKEGGWFTNGKLYDSWHAKCL